MKRTERVGAIVRILTQHPNHTYSLNYFCQHFQAAKSTVSEDVSAAKQLLLELELGRIETTAGAKGGIRFFPMLFRCRKRRYYRASLYEPFRGRAHPWRRFSVYL